MKIHPLKDVSDNKQAMAEESDDIAFVRLMGQINYFARQHAAGATSEEVPFFQLVSSTSLLLTIDANLKQEEGSIVKRILVPEKVVAVEGTPYFRVIPIF
jgi:hypothetical protein